MQQVTSEEVRAALGGEDEIAFIDVREHGQYGEGRPFLAVNIPYSRLEIDAPALLPCKSAPIVLIDDADGVADKAAGRLKALGHTDISILAGGASGWSAAGYRLFKGVNVPSKAFGELLEQSRHTPMLEVQELRDWRSQRRNVILLDGRPPDEHRKMSVPGSIGCPNGELAYRLPALAPDATTPIVIHCAGRTRSILGAETLRLMGVPNPVYALKNGTQGWRLAGLELEHGSQTFYSEISDDQRAASRESARSLRSRFDIPAVDLRTLDAWREDEARTLYVFDVRTEEEFLAGRLPGARHAPGGQLVQATDHWIAVRGARIVLTDDTGLRAALAAFWLRQMGHDAHVLAADVSRLVQQESGRPPELAVAETLPQMSVARLEQALGRGAVLLDLNPGTAYRKGHIAGARWRIRPRLDRLGLANVPVVLLAQDRRIAELAAVDLRDLGVTDLSYAPGDAEAWRAAGLAVVATPDDPSDAACIDYLFFVHDRHDGNLDAARRYLEWETGLIDQMDEHDCAAFRLVV